MNQTETVKNIDLLSEKKIVRRNKRGKLKKYRALYLMLIPGILYFLLFHYGPMYGVILAFKDFKITQGILNSPWAGFKQFSRAFSDPYFLTVLKNTLIISFYKLIFAFPVPICFALLLSEISNLKFKKIVQTVSYLPHFISWVVLSGIFFSIFSLHGPVNLLLNLFGIDPILFLGNSSYFRTVLVLTHIFQSFGWGSIIYFAAIAGIDPQLYEAAIMDGASRFKRIIYITIPMLVPVISILLILSMSGILEAGFDQVFNMYNPKVYEVGDIIDTYVYRKGLVEMDYSYSTAVGLFKSLVALILIISVNTLVKRMGGKENTLW